MLALDLLHRPEPHHPLVSCLEPSDGRRANDLQPFPFLFRNQRSMASLGGVSGGWCGLRRTGGR